MCNVWEDDGVADAVVVVRVMHLHTVRTPFMYTTFEIDWLSCGFTPHSTPNRSFRRHFPKPTSWLVGLVRKKTKPNTQKHAFTNQKNVQHKKLKPVLVTFNNIWPGNEASLCSNEKISKGGDTWGKSEDKRIKPTVYIAPKSKIERRAHYTPEPGGENDETSVQLTNGLWNDAAINHRTFLSK